MNFERSPSLSTSLELAAANFGSRLKLSIVASLWVRLWLRVFLRRALFTTARLGPVMPLSACCAASPEESAIPDASISGSTNSTRHLNHRSSMPTPYRQLQSQGSLSYEINQEPSRRFFIQPAILLKRGQKILPLPFRFFCHNSTTRESKGVNKLQPCVVAIAYSTR